MSVHAIEPTIKADLQEEIDKILPEKVLAELKERLEKIHSDFAEVLWSDVEWSLKDDMQSRIESEVVRQAGYFVESLLCGNDDALTRFNLKLGKPGWNNYIPGEYDGKGIRRKLVEDHQEFLQNKVIESLEAENAQLKEDLKWAKRHY